MTKSPAGGGSSSDDKPGVPNPLRHIEEVLREDLDDYQFEAAMDPAPEILTLACAGSGKSRTLAYRIARLVSEGNDPSGIVAFTFTEKAAETMKRRIAEALQKAGLNPGKIGAMFVGTIHSYCKWVLSMMDARYRQFDVLDDNRLVLYLVSRYPELQLHELRRSRRVRFFDTIREVKDAWKTVNDEMIDLDDVERQDARLGGVLKGLRENLDRDNFIDFSQMIRLVVEALKAARPGVVGVASEVKHLMVDEYQDVNPAQEDLIRELRKVCQTLFVVGDDDQAIYAWRGADVNNILTFSDRYPHGSVHTLPKNYRSIPPIVTTADAFAGAELGATRIAKNPQADEAAGTTDFRVLWFGTRPEEAGWVVDQIANLRGAEYQDPGDPQPSRGMEWADFAILMRSTRVPELDGSPRHAAFTDALRNRGVPFTLEAGGSVFDRREVAVLRDTLELLRDRSPTRDETRRHFDSSVVPSFPSADFERLAQVLTEWGRRIHGPIDGARRRILPQKLVHDLLNGFGIQAGIRNDTLSEEVVADLGVFSRIFQDIEAVYVSVDSTERFQEILNFLQNVAASGYDMSAEGRVARPNAVTVSTVHKAKGQEFPVVFVVDVEAQRFPRKRGKYRGWLPIHVIQRALDRGAYQSTRDEEARLFYTALTRAGRCLYVTGASSLPAGKSTRRQSVFFQRVSDGAISTNPRDRPRNLNRLPPALGFDESVLPTAFSEIKYYMLCPKDYWFRKWMGFSPPIPDMFGFGLTVHAAVGKLHQTFPESEPSPEEARAITAEVFHLKHVPPSADPEERPGPFERARDKAVEIMGRYADDFEEDFRQKRQLEVRFEAPIRRGLITGAIDLLVEYDTGGNIVDASVIDFKSIEMGSEEGSEAYDWTELALQVQLYAMAALEVLGKDARTGKVHFLRDSQRVDIPVSEEAISAAMENLEWATNRILLNDFPMRPAERKCDACDWKDLCPKVPQEFATDTRPPAIHVPTGEGPMMILAFREFEGESS